MASNGKVEPDNELSEVTGALQILSDLREQFEQWRGEEEDKAKLETLDNVIAHIEEIESEYRIRREKLQKTK
jgi:hypothetical protein